MKHSQVCTAWELETLALQRRSVVVKMPYGDWRVPAAFLVNMQFRLVMGYLHRGIYVYPRPYRKPVALLEEGFPPGSTVTWPADNPQREAMVIQSLTDVLYVHCWGGTSFIPKHMCRLVR